LWLFIITNQSDLSVHSKETKARWEAVHTLSLNAEKIPDMILSVLPVLQSLVEKDKSTIVRDYAMTTVANYAKQRYSKINSQERSISTPCPTSGGDEKKRGCLDF